MLVVLHSWTGGFKSGIFTAVVSALVGNYFFSEPRYTLGFGDLGSTTQAVVYILQVTLISYFVHKIHQENVLTKFKFSTARESETHLHNIIDSLPNYLIVIDTNNDILQANKTLTHAVNMKFKEVVGQDVFKLKLWTDNADIRNSLKNAIKKAKIGETTRFDSQFKLYDGKLIDVDLVVWPILSRDGRLDHIIISATDITERKEYEQDLKQVEETYTKLVNSNIIGMAILDREGKVLEVNDAFLNIIGRAKKPFLSGRLRWDDINPPEQIATQIELLHTFYNDQVTEPVEMQFVDAKRNIVPVMMTAVVIDADSELLLALVIDISERKKLEQRKDEFISIASHELKTPLTSIKSYSQIIEKQLSKSDDTRSKMFLGKLISQIDRLTQLVTELLDVTKIQAGKLELNKTKFNLHNLLTEIIEEVKTTVDDFNIDIVKGMPKVEVNADKFRISQVLTNLLVNAVKYSGSGRQINVYIDKPSPQLIKVTVEDFGIGIPEAKQKHLFEKFYRAVPELAKGSEGLGLGLYLCAEIIARHNGTIGVESQEGRGSKFFFTLPIN